MSWNACLKSPAATTSMAENRTDKRPDAFAFEVADIEGRPYGLEQHRGHALLIVNTASACGYTPQLAGLQQLHDGYAAQGLVVLGFPCNQFGGQDPGSADEIAAFCRDRYQVSFPLMGKVEVNGPNADPLFVWLKQAAPGLMGSEAIKWNFTKFLVARDGLRVQRFATATPPEAMVPKIELALRP